MYNPCETCNLRFGHAYMPDCDDKCEFVSMTKENKRLKAESNIVQHGQWIHMDDYDSLIDSTWMCSCCNGKLIMDFGDSPINHGFSYYPMCGAKMCGEEQHEA